MNNFCSDINPENVICFTYKKENSKGLSKMKVSHQFPNMNIVKFLIVWIPY